jgi:hypothetical protein
MEDTIGLAGSLGLINRGGAAFGGNVLTRAANKELEISVAEKKAEAARLAKQAKEEKALQAKISASGKFDELARKDVEKMANDMLMTRGYLDAKRNYEYKLDLGRQEEATRERAAAKELFSKNDYLISPEDRKAIIEHNIPYLTERAKDATSGIKADENLPNVFRVAPEKMIKRMDANKMMTDIGSNISKDESSYDYSKKSKTINVNGKNIVTYPVKENILAERANNVLGYGVDGDYQGNPEIAANFIDANKPKIDAVIAANPKLTPYEATKKVFIDVLREKTMGGDTRTLSKGLTINNTFTSTSGGGYKSKDVDLNPETSKDYPDGTLYRYNRAGSKPDVYNLNVGSKDDSVKKFTEVNYVVKLDDETGLVIGKRKKIGDADYTPENEAYSDATGDYKNVPASIKVPLSVVYGELRIDDKTWKSMKSEGKPAVKAATNTGGAPKPKPASAGGAPRPKK